jgi:hypothetical protein
MQEVSHLYRITDQTSGRFYIGKHKGRHQNGYWGSGTRIKRHVKKHGVENLKYEVLAISTNDYILELEAQYVTLDFIAQNPMCMNLKSGGIQATLSPESIAKMAQSLRGKPSWNKGIPMSLQTKSKLSEAKKGIATWTGRKHTEESKKKLSLAKIGSVAWNKGLPPSQDVRDKISKSLMGNVPWNVGMKLTEEQISQRVSNMRLANLGKKRPFEVIQKIRDAVRSKPDVICPHCLKKGRAQGMTRWHFDNCKQKGTNICQA